MKRLMIICSILTAIIASGIFSLTALDFYSKEISDSLKKTAYLAETEPQTALEQLREIQQDWERNEPKIGLFVHEDPLLTFSEQLERCNLLLDNNQTDDAVTEIKLASYMIRNLFHQQLPTLENIF